MRNMLAFLAALTLTLAGVGWYLGWYTIQRQPSASGKSTFSIEVDGNKASADTEKFLQSVEKKIQKNTDSSTREPAPATGTTDGKTDGAKVSKSTTSPDNPPKVILGVPPHAQ